MSVKRTCGEVIETSAALVGLGMMLLCRKLHQNEYELGVAYVMGYEDAMACNPCEPLDAIDSFKKEDQ